MASPDRHWKADLTTEFDPFESGLHRFVELDRPDFPGKPALLAKRGAPPWRRFVNLRVDCDFAPPHSGDSLMICDRVVGTVTSAAWGHRVGENLAMGFVDPGHPAEGAPLEVLVLGRLLSVTVVALCRYDPGNTRVRA